MAEDTLNQTGFWLPSDILSVILSDDDDDDEDMSLFLNSRIPFDYRPLPEMKTQQQENHFLPSSSSTHFVPPPSAPQIAGGGGGGGFGSLKFSDGSSNATFQAPSSTPSTIPLGESDSYFTYFTYALPPPPPPPPSAAAAAANHSLGGLTLSPDYYKGQLKHHSSPILGRLITEVYRSHQNIMVQNRAGERIIGNGGDSMMATGGRCDPIIACPPLAQQRPNLQLLRQGVSGMGGSEMKRENAGMGGSEMKRENAAGMGGSGMKREYPGTGVFFPRRPPDPSWKKPGDGMGRRKAQQQLKNGEGEMPPLESFLPHEWTY